MKNTFILDFETTGLNPYHDEIIEIAIKPYGKNTIYTKLTKPLKTKKLHHKIVEITKITDQLLESEGIYVYNAFEEMIEFIKSNITDDGPIYLLAHNGTMFDFILLQTLFKNYNNVNTLSEEVKNIYNRFYYFDTLLLSRLLLPDRFSHSQNSLAKYYSIEQKAAHRAFGDVMVLEEIYENIIRTYCINNNLNFKEHLDINFISKLLYDYSL